MRLTAAVLCAVALVACQTQRASNSFANLVNRPLPTTDAQRDSECAALRSEVARQESLGQMGAAMQQNQMMAMAYLSMTRKNIAYLQSRYSQIQCDVIRVAPTQPIIPGVSKPDNGMTFDQCFAKCRELTSRTENECFDSCRH